MSPYTLLMIWMSSHVLCGEKRGQLGNLPREIRGWKPNRTATKSLGRWNSFSAVAPLQFLLMLGCRGRQERFRRSVPHWEKDLGRCFRSFLALARKMDSKESEKLRWEDFKQYHGELSIKYLLMGDWKNKQFGNISLYLSSYNENFKCFSTNNFI